MLRRKLTAALPLLAAITLLGLGQWLLVATKNMSLTAILWAIGLLALWSSLRPAGSRSPILLRWLERFQHYLPWPLSKVGAGVAGFALVIGARALVGSQFNAPRATEATILWLLGVAFVTYGCWPNAAGTRRLEIRDSQKPISTPQSLISLEKSEVALLVVFTVAALALRLVSLAQIPWLMSGDEGSVGLEAVNWLTGFTTNPFVTGWSSHPTFYFIWQSWAVALFGRALFALRLTSAVAGALTIPLLYLFARRHWGRGVAVAAAGVLAGLAVHIHWSRLSLDPVYDPIFALVVLGAVIEGSQTEDSGRARRWFILAGLVFGVSLYFWGSRLLAVQMVVMAVYYLAAGRQRFWQRLGHWLAFAAVGLAVDLPLFIQFYTHPHDFFARMNQVGIFQLGHVARAAEPLNFLGQQLLRATLAFNYYADTSPFYHPGLPMLRPVMSFFFIIGLGYALWRWFRPPEFALLSLMLGTMLFGGALIITPPQSNHYVISFPAVAILIGLGIVEPGKRLKQLWGGPQRLWAVWLIAMVVLLAADDARWYFRDYTPARLFGDTNTEVAHVLAYRLAEQEEAVRFYFFGPQRMWAGFPSIRYLAANAEAYDVAERLTGRPEFIAFDKRPIFVFLPERVKEAEPVMAACPGGTLELVIGNKGRPLFYWYEPAERCN